MAIKDRNLGLRTRLVGSYKGQQYMCSVEVGKDGKPAYILADGKWFKSPSAAASAVMGSKAVNGWLFWTVTEGNATEPRPAAKPAKQARGKGLIYRLPNQQGVETGYTRFYCNGCLKSFVLKGSEVPAACPNGHNTRIFMQAAVTA